MIHHHDHSSGPLVGGPAAAGKPAKAAGAGAQAAGRHLRPDQVPWLPHGGRIRQTRYGMEARQSFENWTGRPPSLETASHLKCSAAGRRSRGRLRAMGRGTIVAESRSFMNGQVVAKMRPRRRRRASMASCCCCWSASRGDCAAQPARCCSPSTTALPSAARAPCSPALCCRWLLLLDLVLQCSWSLR